MDYEDANIFDLLSSLNPSDEEKCAELDPHIASKFKDTESLAEAFYYMCYGNLYELLPKTRERINAILSDHLSEDKDIDWWRFEAYRNWLLDDLKNQLAAAWLNDDSAQCVWIADSVPSDSPLIVQALSKMTNIYKGRRSAKNLEAIETLFSRTSAEYLDAGCKVISSSTPAVAVCLLSRNDVDEKYTLKGLKALSKLSKQRSVNTKVNFDMLGNLGPKARIDAMRQLLGMIGGYRGHIRVVSKRSPFTSIPTRDEVETFLFPCSLKYDEQVKELLKEFDNLVNKH